MAKIGPTDRLILEKTASRIFEAGGDAAFGLIEEEIQKLDLKARNTLYGPTVTLLEALRNFFQALKLVQSQANFSDAGILLEAAAEGFQQVGVGKLRDLSVGIRVYAAAVVELQKMNFSAAVELMEKVKGYLRKAGNFASDYESIIDVMEPDALFAGGLRALAMLDLVNAQMLIGRASKAAEQVAEDYFEEEDPDRYKFLGAARVYSAAFTLARATSELNQFAFDQIVGEDLTVDAVQAIDLLGKADVENEVTKRLIHGAKVYLAILEVIGELAEVMLRSFRSSFRLDPQVLSPLVKKVRDANALAAGLGPDAAAFVRFCSVLSNQVTNLERLGRTDVKSLVRE